MDSKGSLGLLKGVLDKGGSRGERSRVEGGYYAVVDPIADGFNRGDEVGQRTRREKGPVAESEAWPR